MHSQRKNTQTLRSNAVNPTVNPTQTELDAAAAMKTATDKFIQWQNAYFAGSDSAAALYDAWMVAEHAAKVAESVADNAARAGRTTGTELGYGLYCSAEGVADMSRAIIRRMGLPPPIARSIRRCSALETSFYILVTVTTDSNEIVDYLDQIQSTFADILQKDKSEIKNTSQWAHHHRHGAGRTTTGTDHRHG